METTCDKRLLIYSKYEKIYRNEYYELRECPDELSDSGCFRRPCNCDPVVSEQNDTWECLPRIDLILTRNVVFLSLSPMNYTFDARIDKNNQMDRLELGFGLSHVSDHFFK